MYSVIFKITFVTIKALNNKNFHQQFVSIETGSMYMQYIQGILPNLPAGTTFIEIYNQSAGLFGTCTYLGIF